MGFTDHGACRFWRKSISLEDGLIGIYPAWNAVVGLNPAAAVIWDALIETGDRAATLARYRERVRSRSEHAAEDIDTCLEIWQHEGLFRTPRGQGRGGDGLSGATGEETWRFERTICVGGRSVTVMVDDPVLAAAIEELLADFPSAGGPAEVRLQAVGPQGGWRICLDGAFHRRAQDLPEARGIVVGEIIRLMAAEVPWKAVLHGAVLTKAGQTVLLTGQSGAGKSTLSAEMVAQGWKLVAEDCAAFDENMYVAPMPFAFSFKSGSWSLLSQSFPAVQSAQTHRIGNRAVRYQRLPADVRADLPARPDLILDVCYRSQMAGDEFELGRLTQMESLKLFFNEESFVDFEADPDSRFVDFATRTPAYSLRHGGGAAAQAAISSCLETPETG